MAQVKVNLGENSYPIYISQGNIASLGRLLQEMSLSAKVLVISDENVGKLYGEVVLHSLKEAGFTAELFCVRAGEESKSLAVAEILYTKAIRTGLDRKSPIIALGGGVVGDLAGFIAATYMRGVPFIQVPTSLLAQVDSSVGGKVAIDHALGKNLIGAFYQPRLVLIDTNVLNTLPQNELLAGLGEVVKYGAIADEDFFSFLRMHVGQILNKEAQALAYIVKRNCEIKAEVVEQDEQEAGLRMVLNFGHTIGHAVEANAAYHGYKHGEAIAIGMHGAALISSYMGLCNQKTVGDLCQVLSMFSLPVNTPAKPEALLPYLVRDKKNVGGKINWVLLEKIGRCTIRNDVPEKFILKALQEITCR